jgi:tetrahydromethanopterin S-methyltransferase subunit G
MMSDFFKNAGPWLIGIVFAVGAFYGGWRASERNRDKETEGIKSTIKGNETNRDEKEDRIKERIDDLEERIDKRVDGIEERIEKNTIEISAFDSRCRGYQSDCANGMRMQIEAIGKNLQHSINERFGRYDETLGKIFDRLEKMAGSVEFMRGKLGGKMGKGEF